MPNDSEQITKLRARNAIHGRYSRDWEWADALRNGLLSDPNQRAKFLNDKGGTETQEDFAQRAKLTDYSPDTPRIVSRVMGVVWADEPRRDFATPELQEFIEKAGPDGEGLEELSREAAQEASWKRYAVLLMDRPALSEEDAAKIKTKADEKAAGLALPYFTLFPAERVLEWRTDSRGRLIYVRLTSGKRQVSETTSEEEVREIELRGITLWRIVEQKGQGEKLETAGGKLTEYSDGIKAAGKLPIVVVRWEKILGDPIDSRTPLIECLMAELGAMRCLSMHRWDCYLAGHPHLKWWKHPTATGSGSDASASPTTYHMLNPGNSGQGIDKEDMAWLEVTGAGMEQVWQAYKDAKLEILNKAGIDGRASATGGTDKGVASSGAQVQLEFEVTEGCTLKGLARLAEAAENDMIELVKLDRGIKEDAEVEYKTKGFMGTSPDKALTRAQSWQRGPSETYAREAWKQAGKESFPNVPADLHDQAHKEIEAADMKPPAPPDVMGGAASLSMKPKFAGAVPQGGGGQKPTAGRKE
jgi:hypothetical protein